MKLSPTYCNVLAACPEVLICDEPFSGLDVAAKVLIGNLLARVNRKFGLTLLVISHDPLPLKAFCHRMAVMKNGRIFETASLAISPGSLK